MAKQMKHVKKVKAPGTKKKGAPKAKSAGHSGGGNASIFHHLAMQTCSVTNPFCPEANNGKWPDNSYVKTNTYNINGEKVNLTTNASGDAGVLFIPQFRGQYATVTCVGDVCTPNAADSQLVTMPTGVNRFRITSWGLKVTCSTPAMTTQGTLNIRGFSPMQLASLSAYGKQNRLTDLVEDIPLTSLMNKEVFIIPLPLGTEARMFRAVSDYSGAWQGFNNIGWQVISVNVTGGIASTVCAAVEAYYHYELIFDDGNAVTAYATPPPASSPVVKEANASVLQKIGGVIKSTAKTIDDVANSKAFQYIAAIGMSMAAKNPAPMLAIGNIPQRGRIVD